MRKETTQSAPEPYLTDYLRPGLDVIFVGAAASIRSAQEGHWYAGPTNKFYLLLHQSGFTPCQMRPGRGQQSARFRRRADLPAPLSLHHREPPAAAADAGSASDRERENPRKRAALRLLQRQRRVSDGDRKSLSGLGRADGANRRLPRLGRSQQQRPRRPLGGGTPRALPRTAKRDSIHEAPPIITNLTRKARKNSGNHSPPLAPPSQEGEKKYSDFSLRRGRLGKGEQLRTDINHR